MPWQANNNAMGELRMPSVAAHAEAREAAKGRLTVRLHMLAAEKVMVARSDCADQVAYVSAGVPGLAALLAAAAGEGKQLYMHAREHAVCVVRICEHSALAPAGAAGTAGAAILAPGLGTDFDGFLALSEVMRANFKVCAGTVEEWSLYSLQPGRADRDAPLADVTLEVRPRRRPRGAGVLRLDGRRLAAQLVRHCSSNVLSANELLLMRPNLRLCTAAPAAPAAPAALTALTVEAAVATATSVAVAAAGAGAGAGAEPQCRGEEGRERGSAVRATAVATAAEEGDDDDDEEGDGSDDDDDDDDDEEEDDDDEEEEEGLVMVARVLSMTPSAEELPDGEDAAAADDDALTVVETFRGLVTADTVVYLRHDDSFGMGADVFELVDAAPRPAGPPPRGMVDVTTSDEELFPVKRKLLRPCIKLTSAVMAGAGVHADATTAAGVPVDCCTFDRVLLFLEAQARGPDGAASFSFGAEHTDAMLQAARDLGLRGLEELCLKRLGEFESRVRTAGIPWAEVMRRNGVGERLLVMDGMVLDVTRWLEEHPGGSVIIPEQALGVDSTVFFELYHSSRQSFRYLKEFYIGEVAGADRDSVPAPPELPSDAFVEQLRQWTTWRITPEDKVHKSF